MNHQTLATWIIRRAAITPQQVAIIYKGESRTYAELAERTLRLAHALKDLGIRKGDRVGFFAPNHPAHLETLFACGLLGAIWVPLHFRFGADELIHAINESGCLALVYAPEGQGMVDKIREQLTVRTYIATERSAEYALEYEKLLAEASHEPIEREVTPEDVCLIAYTSGTTGINKGVVLTHANVVINVFNLLSRIDYVSSDIMLTAAPLFRMGGLGLLMPVFFKGATAVILPAYDPDEALELIEKYRVSVFFNGPRQFDQMQRSPRFKSADLSSMRFCICGGDVVPQTLIQAYLERGIVFQQGYGLTETSPAALLLDEKDVMERNGSAGSPLLLNEAKVVRSDLSEVSPKEIGELLIRGPNVMKGYWERGDIDKEVFVGGWLRTGDAATVDEAGFFYIVDRVKDAMLLSGARVYPSQIEKILATHPAVEEAAVIGIEEDGEEKPLAFVCLKADSDARVEEILFHSWKRLPSAWVPTEIRVIKEMPRNPNGKLMRRSLRKLALEQPTTRAKRASAPPSSVNGADAAAAKPEGSGRQQKPGTAAQSSARPSAQQTARPTHRAGTEPATAAASSPARPAPPDRKRPMAQASVRSDFGEDSDGADESTQVGPDISGIDQH